MSSAAFERAMKLAVLSGFKAALGPALLKTAQGKPDARQWVTAAMAEMVLDKVGILPSRSRLPLLIPHAISGAWVAQECMREEGIEDDPWIAPMGAAVAAGIATFAPMLRIAASRVLGIPDMVLGVGEDYCALKLGSEAVGLPMEELTRAAKDSVENFKETVGNLKESMMPIAQSVGAGSM